ncbi:hypothetical protein NDU88_005889 [Pleurodeles waltl]|uniref:Uncharacterized protein n=1 Tax=Pleurodeles waltl TaxID=8319 RepID=A0AAV7TWU5_PLEWA|nr:hypothetical protein NDU88_005889 [Pleurodeles waltl]
MMASITEDTKSMCLRQRLTTVETQAALVPDRDQELLYLNNKVIDLEDRSRRDNVHFLGFWENMEEADVQSFLKTTLPQVTGLTFDPPWSFKERTDWALNAATGTTTHNLS